MSRVSETIVQLTLMIVILSSTFVAGYWVLLHYLRLPFLFVIAALGPSALLVLLAALYGYYIGNIKYWEGDGSDATEKIAAFQQRVRLFTFGSLLALPIALAAVSVFWNVTVAGLFALIALAISPWSLRRLRGHRT
jgi:hypothetical protein